MYCQSGVCILVECTINGDCVDGNLCILNKCVMGMCLILNKSDGMVCDDDFMCTVSS